MGEQWMTVEEIAEDLGISKMTVYRLIHGEQIAAMRVGKQYRVARVHYQAYLKKARTQRGDSRN